MHCLMDLNESFAGCSEFGVLEGLEEKSVKELPDIDESLKPSISTSYGGYLLNPGVSDSDIILQKKKDQAVDSGWKIW